MKNRKSEPESRLFTVLTLLRNGVLIGLSASALGAGVSYLTGEQHWGSVLRGINGASLLLAVWAGLIVLGHMQGRELIATRQQELMHGNGLPMDGSLYPWRAILTTAFASIICALVWWALKVTLNQ